MTDSMDMGRSGKVTLCGVDASSSSWANPLSPADTGRMSTGSVIVPHSIMILGSDGTSGTGEKRPRTTLRGVAGVADRTLLLLGVAAPGHESSSLSKSFSSANRLWPPGVTEVLFSA